MPEGQATSSTTTMAATTDPAPAGSFLVDGSDRGANNGRMATNHERIYDGALHCGECDCGCPVVEIDRAQNMVRIHDPAKPERGMTEMTVAEYNALLAHARPVPTMADKK